jgi:hypothetical protein
VGSMLSPGLLVLWPFNGPVVEIDTNTQLLD